jgi:hypothetical protein
MLEVNQSMLQLLYDLQERPAGTPDPKLEKLIAGGLIEKDGCWFLTSMSQVTTFEFSKYVEKHKDRTGVECFINKVYLDAKPPLDPVILQKQALLYVEALRQLLEPHGVFKIIVSFSDTELNDSPNYLTCTVRFHKVRAGESWLANDLEGYKLDAVMVITTGTDSNQACTLNDFIAQRCRN